MPAWPAIHVLLYCCVTINEAAQESCFLNWTISSAFFLSRCNRIPDVSLFFCASVFLYFTSCLRCPTNVSKWWSIFSKLLVHVAIQLDHDSHNYAALMCCFFLHCSCYLQAQQGLAVWRLPLRLSDHTNQWQLKQTVPIRPADFSGHFWASMSEQYHWALRLNCTCVCVVCVCVAEWLSIILMRYLVSDRLWMRFTQTVDIDAWYCTFSDNQSHWVIYSGNSLNSGCGYGRGRRAITGEQSVLCLYHLTPWLHPSKNRKLSCTSGGKHISGQQRKTKRPHFNLFNQPQHVVIHRGYCSSSLVLLLWIISKSVKDIYTSWNTIFSLHLFLLQPGAWYNAL